MKRYHVSMTVKEKVEQILECKLNGVDCNIKDYDVEVDEAFCKVRYECTDGTVLWDFKSMACYYSVGDNWNWVEIEEGLYD